MSDNQSNWDALREIIASLPAHLAYYGSALGAIVIAGSGAEGMASIVGNIGAGLLGNLIADLAKGKDISDEDVRRRAEEAVTKSDINRLLTERDFWRAYVRLVRQLDAQKAVSQEIVDELRTGFGKVATAEQMEEVKELLLQALEDKKPPQKPRVFISYRRKDATEFAQQLHDALEAADVDAWLDVRDMPSGDTFIAQIDRAIAAADYFLLVATPQAIESDYCRDEWKKALEHYKPIIPLMRMGTYADLPKEAFVYLNDARDFRDESHWEAQIIHLLKQVCIAPSQPGPYYGVPRLPSHYLTRPQLLDELRHALTAHKTTVLISPSQIIGVHGMGGVGKSVLAAAISRDYFVRRTFKDGIFWLTFGTSPNVADLWKTLAQYLGYQGKSFSKWEDARDFFESETRDKECLLILDDLWDSHHADAFLRLGDKCRIFATSRNADLLPEIGAKSYAIGLLSVPESEQLLKQVTERESLPAQANPIIERCDNLPLALAMIGAMVKGKREQTWEDALADLKAQDLEEIRARFPEYPHPNLFAALQVSIEALDEELRERYADFAIFPDDVGIPEEVPITFWKPLEGRKVRRKLDELVSRNLLIRADDGSLSLHDLQLSYLRRTVTDIPQRNQRLLHQYNPNGAAWQNVCDAYLWKHLAHHLIQSKRTDELRQLLTDYAFLQAKLDATDVDALIADCDYLPNVYLAQLMRSFWTTSAHVLGNHDNHDQLHNQLLGRLGIHEGKYSEIQTLLSTARDAAQHNPCPLLILQKPSLENAGGLLDRILKGHTDSVRGTLALADGRFLSWCDGYGDGDGDHTLRLWSREGEALAILEGHHGSVSGVLALADGRFLSWCGGPHNNDDHTLRLWSEEGKPLAVLAGHLDGIGAVRVLSDGRFLSWCGNFGIGNQDYTLRLWSGKGEPLSVLNGHRYSVKGVTVLSDGRFLSWSADRTLRLWSDGGESIAVLEGHTGGIGGVLELSDKRFLSWCDAGGGDHTLRLWSREGKPLAVLYGHTDSVWGVRTLADERFLSWSADNTLRLWSSKGEGEPLSVLRGHTKTVYGVLGLKDGRFLSWGADRTLRLWSNDGQAIAALEGHTDSIWGVLVLSDERILSWSADNTLRLWSRKGEALATFKGHLKTVRGAQVLSDERILSWSADNTLRLWSSEGMPIAVLEGHTGQVNGVLALSNRRFLSWSDDKTLRLWLGEGEALDVSKKHVGRVYATLALSDGRFLSWSFDGALWLWSREGELLGIREEHTSWVKDFVELLDGRFLSWSDDGTLRLWSKEVEALAVLKGHKGSVYGALALSDGRFLSWGWDNTLRLWSSTGGSLVALEGHKGSVYGALALSDGRFLSWSVDNTLRLWSSTGEPLAVLEGHEGSVYGALALSDGRFLSWCHDSKDCTLRLWSGEGKTIAVLAGHKWFVNGALELAGDRLLSWSADGTLRLWSEEGATIAVLEGHEASVESVLALFDGRLVSWSVDKTVRLWSRNGDSLGKIERFEADRLRYETLRTLGRVVPPVEWAISDNTLIGINTGGTQVCRFVADGELNTVSQAEDRTIIVGGDGGVIHFLRPNTALEEIMRG